MSFFLQDHVRDASEAFSWKILRREDHSPDLAPSDYHLFSPMSHAVEQRFGSYEDVKKWLENGS